MRESSKQAFFALASAGLWEREVKLAKYGVIDYAEVYELASEQSITGLIAAGLEHVEDVKPPKEELLTFIGDALLLEHRNKAMNVFVAELIEKLRKAGIYTLLVKGQGIAQCYGRPLWRACGDIDLFLSDENYTKAAVYLKPLAFTINEERPREKHLAMTIDGWEVELHGRLYGGFSKRVEKELDSVYDKAFCGGDVRSWINGDTQVFLLSAGIDVFYVFTHILQHFYKEGVGLRQICDWCRLLWTYRDTMDVLMLESRIKKAGLMTAWKAFGAYAVDYLGMPVEAMPLYSDDKRWKRKAKRINIFILSVGNMGHNRDASYFSKYPYLVRKVISMFRRIGDLIDHSKIFPIDSWRFFPYIIFNGLKSAVRGEG
jgi:hypothetical protein